MNGIMHPINVSASPPPHGTVTGIVTGIGTGKGIGTESVIGEMPPVDDMDLPRHGSGIGSEREMPPRGVHTKKKKKRRSNQLRFLPSSLGLSARCPSRQGLMVSLNSPLLVYHQF